MKFWSVTSSSLITALECLANISHHDKQSLAEEAHKGNINYAPWVFINKAKSAPPSTYYRDYKSFSLRVEDILKALRSEKNIVYKFTIIDQKMRLVATPRAESGVRFFFPNPYSLRSHTLSPIRIPQCWEIN